MKLQPQSQQTQNGEEDIPNIEMPKPNAVISHNNNTNNNNKNNNTNHSQNVDSDEDTI